MSHRDVPPPYGAEWDKRPEGDAEVAEVESTGSDERIQKLEAELTQLTEERNSLVSEGTKRIEDLQEELKTREAQCAQLKAERDVEHTGVDFDQLQISSVGEVQYVAPSASSNGAVSDCDSMDIAKLDAHSGRCAFNLR
jgi:ElaB/YqjD/DUF883 family membrane-anchored ribosome-binding protein